MQVQNCSCSMPYEKCCGARTAPIPQQIQVGTSTTPAPLPVTESDIRRILREELKKAGVI